MAIFTIDGSGSTQQAQWVNDALATCTYDFTNLDILVTFVWSSNFSGSLHGDYMYTSTSDYYNFTVTINSRADDPNASDLVGGLPDPFAQVHDFYVESVIHELGHCVHYAILGTQLGKQDSCCGCLMHPKPSPTLGFVTGTHSDYAVGPPTLAWANSVKEGIAETFKDLTNPSRVFDNRSNWKLIPDHISQFGAALTPPNAHWQDSFSGEHGLTHDGNAAHNQVGINYLENDTSGSLTLSGGTLVPTPNVPSPANGTYLCYLLTPIIKTPALSVLPVKEELLVVKIVGGTWNSGSDYLTAADGDVMIQWRNRGVSPATVAANPDWGVELRLPVVARGHLGDIGSVATLLLDVPQGAVGSFANVSTTFPITNIASPSWLALRYAYDGRMVGEFWTSDPLAGGTPKYTVYATAAEVTANGIHSNAALLQLDGSMGGPAGSLVAGPIVADDFSWTGGPDLPPWLPAWPYFTGDASFGDAGTGILRFRQPTSA